MTVPCITCGSDCGQCGGVNPDTNWELRQCSLTGKVYRWTMERDVFGRWRPVRKEEVPVVNRK